jgi:hypothetical protein
MEYLGRELPLNDAQLAHCQVDMKGIEVAKE